MNHERFIEAPIGSQPNLTRVEYWEHPPKETTVLDVKINEGYDWSLSRYTDVTSNPTQMSQIITDIATCWSENISIYYKFRGGSAAMEQSARIIGYTVEKHRIAGRITKEDLLLFVECTPDMLNDLEASEPPELA